MKQLITSQNIKEKEHTLSLLRIPLNFFSEDEQKKLHKTKDGDTDDFKTNVNGEGGTPDKKVEISEDNPHIHIEFDLNDVEDKIVSPSDRKNVEIANPQSNSEKKSSENIDKQSTTSSKDSKQQSSSHPNQPENNIQSSPQSPSSTPSSSNGQAYENNNKGNTKKRLKNRVSNSKLGKKLKNKAKNSKLGKKLDDAQKRAKEKKDEAAKKLKDKFNKSKAGQKANQLKDQAKNKIANNPTAQKALGAVGDAKDVVNDIRQIKAARQNNNPEAANKAKGDLVAKGAQVAATVIASPAAGKVVKAISNSKVGQKAKEFIGAIITKIEKAVKKIKELVTKSCVGGCVFILIVLLLPIITTLYALAWITNLFGRNGSDIYENDTVLTDGDFKLLVEKANLYSLETLASDTVDRNGEHRLWYTLWIAKVDNDKAPIQHAVAKYMKDYYYYNKDMVDHYYGDTKKENESMKKLIDNGYLLDVKEGDMTSFAYSFETLRTHYDLISLKRPVSSPQRTTEVDGKEVTYYLYSDKHIQILEDVMNNVDELKTTFDDQVYHTWFEDNSDTEKNLIRDWLNTSNEKIEGVTFTDEEQFEIANMGNICTSCQNDSQNGFGNYVFKYIDSSTKKEIQELINSWENISITTILDTKVENVFIPSLNEYRDLSLRDILEKTSKTSYDTEYYTSLVSEILSNPYPSNKKLNSLFYHLTQKLTTLELMTYLLSFEQYSVRMKEIESNMSSYKNASMFDDEFLASFLTFSDIQYYIALASTTDPSFTYEIAMLDAKTSFKNLQKVTINADANLGGIPVFSNWYATYYLSYQCVAKGDSYIVRTNVDSVVENGVAQQLFDKYNVYHGLYDDIGAYKDESGRSLTPEDANRNGFFALFENATGTKLFDFDKKGNMLIQDSEFNKEWEFIHHVPIQDENAQISMGYGQQYSATTVAKYGLSHSNHTGIDYSVPSGTTVYATNSGTAFTVRGNTGYGNYVKIVHDDGYTSYYAHGNGTFYVENGSRVTADQPIMQSGNSGNSTGPHLHFEVRDPSGNTVNPNSYVMGMA